MNINFEPDVSINNHPGYNHINNSHATKNTAAESMTASAWALSIGGNVPMIGAPDADKGTSIDDFQAALSATDVQMKQDYMSVMSLSMSDEDFAELASTGEVPQDMDASDSVTILDDIKAALIKGGSQIAGYTDDLDMAKYQAITGSVVPADELINAMHSQDVPVNELTVQSATDAIALVSSVLPISENATQYLIENKQAPTIENIYHATHSGMGMSDRYSNTRISTEDMQAIMPQIEEMVAKSGIEDTESALEEAKWLVERGIPLTLDNLYRLDDLNELNSNTTTEQIAMSVSIAMGAGIPADKANLSYDESIYTQAEDYIDTLSHITDDNIDAVVDKGLELNLKNIKQSMANEQPTTEQLHARRVLEEVRIHMTVEANRFLLKSNFYIDITPMEELVDALKQAEEVISKNLFPADNAEISESRMTLYRESKLQIWSIPTLPAAVLGQVEDNGDFTYADQTRFTLHHVYESGSVRRDAYIQAQMSYEAIMTAPRADMGDSIRKAFRNVDDILEDMGFDIDEDNQRAVRILGYNEIEITTENIEQVKSADVSLRKALERLTPSRVLEMIRENVNPLDMSIADLNSYLDEQDDEPRRQAENYAKFLMQLERQDEITELERDSYIGIYRMISKLDKTDDAAIGRLMEMGQTASFANLLQAMRSMKHGAMDYRVNDDFGGVDSIRNAPAIDEQINAAFVENLLSSGAPVSFSNLEAMEALRSKRGDWFKPLKDKENENGTNIESTVDDLLEEMTDSESAETAYENMLNEYSDRLNQMIMEADSYIDVKTLQNSMKQISILKSMVRDETYDVPVEIDGESTTIRLTMKHESGAGQLLISTETETIGRIVAEFSFSGKGSGYIAYEKFGAEDKLSQVIGFMSEELSFAPELVKTDRVNPDKYGMLLKKEEQTADISSTELYRISKVFIQAIRKI